MIEYKEGEIIEGVVIAIKNYGAIMIFENGQTGLLHISEIANSFIRNIKRYLVIGKTYQVKVLSVNEDGFLKVSMSKITNEEKEQYRNQSVKKCAVDEDNVDFTALKERLEIWTK